MWMNHAGITSAMVSGGSRVWMNYAGVTTAVVFTLCECRAGEEIPGYTLFLAPEEHHLVGVPCGRIEKTPTTKRSTKRTTVDPYEDHGCKCPGAV